MQDNVDTQEPFFLNISSINQGVKETRISKIFLVGRHTCLSIDLNSKMDNSQDQSCCMNQKPIKSFALSIYDIKGLSKFIN